MIAAADIVAAAIQVARNAYSPYSGFKVGAAALFAEHATLYVGCNVENASYGLTMCAERVAIGSGIAAGAKTLVKIAVAVVDKDGNLADSFMPCGACRQVIQEFSTDATIIVIAGKQEYPLAVLLPLPF